MARTQRPIIGVFDAPALADRAMEALRNAGFRDEQMWSSSRDQAAGGLLPGLKRLFTG